MQTTTHTAVIGAGIAGLTCAQALVASGHHVTIFEKSRGLGGRVATRRADALRFDHGAPHLRITDQWFAQRVMAWCEAQALGTRDLRRRVLDPRGELLREDTSRVYIGQPHMNHLAHGMAQGLTVRTHTRVAPLPEAPDAQGRWPLRSVDGEALGAFERVLITAPAPQTQALLERAHPALAAQCGEATFAPVWSLMLVAPTLELPADKLVVEGDHPIDRVMTVAHTSDPTCLILHASRAWSLAHLEDTPEAVADALVEALGALLRLDRLEASHRVAHRWRYGQVTHDLRTPALYDPSVGLGAAGDWCLGDTVEAACISGDSLARFVLNPLPRHDDLHAEDAPEARA